MRGAMASGVRGTLTKSVVAAAFGIGIAVAGATVPANATPGFAAGFGARAFLDDPDPGFPTGPDDPRCMTMSWATECQGGPYADGPASPGGPTGPADSKCISMPTDPVCAGGPYAPPAAAAAPPIEAAPPAAIDVPPAETPREPFAGGMPDEHIGGGIPDEHIGGGMPGHIGGGGMPGHI
jgi:hypothetical protein